MGRAVRPLVLGALAAILAGCTGAAATSPPATRLAGHAPSSPPPSVSSAPSAVPATPSGTALAWHACGNGLECAALAVPLDYDHPDDTAIRIYLVRAPATDPAHRVGSLVLNYGGPGQSGVQAIMQAGLTGLLPAALRERFDLVSFDPRGVGLSSPLSCVDDATMDRLRALDPEPTTAAGRQAILDGARVFAEGCEARSGPLLPYISTEAVARDLDRIRAALGEDRLTYLGYSYGTYLGARYATLFPDRVRAMVLDAAVDLTMDPARWAEEQMAASEAALDRFLAACASEPACQFRGDGDPARAFDALLARARAIPIPAGGARVLGLGDALSGVQALLMWAAWDDLAAALGAAAAGDGSLLLAAADAAAGRSGSGQYDNSMAAAMATLCMETPDRPGTAALETLAARLVKVAPHLGGVYETGCLSWPVRPETTPPPLAAPAGTPLLVIGGTGDPTTPYAWSERMAASLGNAVLVTRRGEGHTSEVDPGNACLGEAMAAYLVDLTVPPGGLTCAPSPEG